MMKPSKFMMKWFLKSKYICLVLLISTAILLLASVCWNIVLRYKEEKLQLPGNQTLEKKVESLYGSDFELRTYENGRMVVYEIDGNNLISVEIFEHSNPFFAIFQYNLSKFLLYFDDDHPNYYHKKDGYPENYSVLRKSANYCGMGSIDSCQNWIYYRASFNTILEIESFSPNEGVSYSEFSNFVDEVYE
ncbi:hypothetical protein GF389_06215 [Candidatus Dojkabacteria bacterium]|nr:hypothetical protein [Candidatus Dojkabacteria bacterium]